MMGHVRCECAASPATRRVGYPGVERDAAFGPVVVDTYAGPVQVEWDPDAAVTPRRTLEPSLREYLKLRWPVQMPWRRLRRWSTRARMRRRSAMCWARRFWRGGLAGRWRYGADITALRGDTVNPPLVGHDESGERRRGAARAGQDRGRGGGALAHRPPRRYGAAAAARRSLDVDTTVKPLYGHQEGAEVGYNPLKPGRPSHAVRAASWWVAYV